MTGDDGFLARWSRRKRSAAPRKRASATPKASPAPVASDAIAEPPALPSIESIDATSDITPFLAPGVPAELARRALRRAWEADPAIRNFVGLSENAWDFNAPGGVPGFGALTAEDIQRLLDAATDPAEAPDPPGAAAPPAAETPSPAIAETANEAPVAATPCEPDQRKRHAPTPVRRHGALPE